jgi:hypothetical protein
MTKNTYFKSSIITKIILRNIWIFTESKVQKWNGDNSRNTGARVINLFAPDIGVKKHILKS